MTQTDMIEREPFSPPANDVTPEVLTGEIVSVREQLSRGFLSSRGLGWTVSKRPLTTANGQAVDDHVAIVRDDNQRVLGVTHVNYEPVQNLEAFGPFDAVVEEGHAKYVSAGTFKGGAQIWVKARFDFEAEVVPGDVVRAFVLLSNGHDGSRAYSGKKILERLVCKNGLTRSEDARIFTLRHTKNIHERIEWVRGLVESIRVDSEIAIESFRALAGRQMGSAEIETYLRGVFPDPVDTDAIRARGNAERVRGEITALVESGRGAEIPGVRGTAWGLLNAVTEHVDHVRTAGYEEERRLSTIWFGAGANLKAKALDAALALV